MAKLCVEDATKEETWDLGRVRKVIAQSTLGPDGQAQPHTHVIQWKNGLSGGHGLHDLHLSIDSCGPKREWLIVRSKAPARAPVARRPAAKRKR